MLKVAVGIVYNQENEILIAQRPKGKHLEGFWEFPGGKIEKNENSKAALKRELHEELGILMQSAEPLIQREFHYPEKSVLLDFWKVSEYFGTPIGNEGQIIQWVSRNQLSDFRLPDANQTILEYL